MMDPDVEFGEACNRYSPPSPPSPRDLVAKEFASQGLDDQAADMASAYSETPLDIGAPRLTADQLAALNQLADAELDRDVSEPAPEAAPSGRTLDQLADDTLNRVAAFIGECISAESFCGIGVDEMRDEEGKLLSLRLVPCDKDAMGEAVRRVGK